MKIRFMSRRVLIPIIALILMAVFIMLLAITPHYRRMEPVQFYLLLTLVFLALILLTLLFLRGRQLALENRKYVAERNETEAKIIKANRLYFFISQINQMIVKTTDEATLFKKACRIAIELGKFKMAWIGIMDEDTRILKPVIYDGMDVDYLSAIKIIADNNMPEGRGPTGTALLEGKYVFCNDIETDPRMAPWRPEALKRNYLSSIALPIKKSGEVIGAFTLYADTKNFFDAEEIALLEETAGDISFALDFFEKEMQRRNAEAAVLERERRYQTLAESSPVGIFHTDASGYTTYVNPRWCLISGLSFEEALGNGWFSVVHPEDKPALAKRWQEATKKQATSSTEYRFVRPDGTVTWVIGQAVPERNADHEVIGYVGTITDITERKKAEQEIAKVYREKETTLNRINDSVVSLDNDWRYTFLNEAAMATHPEGKNEVIGKTIWEVHPELVGTVFSQKYEEAMRTKNVLEFEEYYAPTDTWFFIKVYPSADGLTIFYKDITERKKVEDELNQNRVFIESIINASPDIIYVYDIEERKNTYVNVGVERTLGYTEQEIKEMDNRVLPTLMHPQDFDYYLQHTYHRYNTINDKEIINHEFRMKDKNNDWHWFYSKESVFVRKQDGTPKQIFGIISDITEIKKAQEEIIKERDLSAAIINSLPGIFYLCNKEGKFLRWNKNCEIVTGYSAEEISKLHPLDLFDESEKDILAKKIANIFEYGQDVVEAPLFLKNRKKVPYYFTGISIEYEGTQCLMGVGIDVAERVEAQEKIKKTTEELRRLATHLQTIREEERKRIGREIHDELGQQLTAIKMDVAWIDKRTPQETTLIKTKLKNIITLLDGSNQSIRRILSELRPGVLDDHGLLEAIEWLGSQFTANTGIPVKFTTAEKVVKSSAPVANCIFRVYQEALTNITRYANAHTVTSSLNIAGDNITVTIEDDGQGFDTASVQNKKSFGILGMKERVLSLAGKFELTSSPGKGTKIIVSLPNSTSNNS